MPRFAAVAAAFGPDLSFDLRRIEAIVARGRADGVDLMVLPDAALGGYLSRFADADPDALPPALDNDHPALAAVAEMAGDMVVCVGYREHDGDHCFNTAVCLWGGGVLGRHRKVHQPPGESVAYTAGDSFDAFDTPVGRLGMLIDYDKTFPEAARSLAVDGAQILACLSAWPTNVTRRTTRTSDDGQSRLFDLYDRARAAENQVVLVSSNQTGKRDGMRFVGQAKVVGPDGEILARTWEKAGIAAVDVDVDERVKSARQVLHHLAERRPQAYR